MTSPNTQPEHFDEQDGWQNCRGGEIAACLKTNVRRRQAERRSMLARSTVTAAGLFVVLGLGVLWLIPQQDAVARISCREVHDLSEQYVAHELDPELTARITKHLGRCPKCQDHVDSLTDQLANALSWLGNSSGITNTRNFDRPLLAFLSAKAG